MYEFLSFISKQKGPKTSHFCIKSNSTVIEGLYSLSVAKTNALISCEVIMHLICTFVFTYAKKIISHDATHMSSGSFVKLTS